MLFGVDCVLCVSGGQITAFLRRVLLWRLKVEGWLVGFQMVSGNVGMVHPPLLATGMVAMHVVWRSVDLSQIKRNNIRRAQRNTDVVSRENKILDWLRVIIVLSDDRQPGKTAVTVSVCF